MPSTRVKRPEGDLYLEALLDLSGLHAPLAWNRVFEAPVNSVELEIGSGKGRFLRKESVERPEVGFLGIERAAKFLRLAAWRVARDGHPNLRLVRADAFEFLARWVPEASLAAVHVYFPDPWPKKRHGKRRLLRPPLYQLAARALVPGGLFAFATDVTWYFEETLEQMAGVEWFARVEAPEREWERVTTNYALKYAREGRSLHLAHYHRNSLPAPPVPPLPERPRRASSTSPFPSEGASP